MWAHGILNHVHTSKMTPKVYSGMHGLLNGGPNTAVMELLGRDHAREVGAFFTCEKIASYVSRIACRLIHKQSIVMDPTCGCGDLLLSVSRNLLIRKTFSPDWQRNHLLGIEREESFVQLAKLRLALQLSHERSERIDEKYFNNIIQANMFDKMSDIKKATIIIANPPYQKMVIPADMDWGKGSASAAAIFMDRIISSAQVGANCIAVLPDVLRAGSRYKAWRSHINRDCIVRHIKVLNQFSKWADVHIFVLHVEKRAVKSENPSERLGRAPSFKKLNGKKLSDEFDVCVGTIVQFRDKKTRKKTPLFCSRDLIPWTEIKRTRQRRNFKGKTFRGPLVLIKRTSRPEDSYRALATIVRHKTPFQVDNHLIVSIPKNGTLKSCRNLVKTLRSSATNDNLNRVMRCRHLTVSCIENLPYSP